MRRETIRAIAVTFEIVGGATLSDGAKQSIVTHLDRFSDSQICNALERCRLECRGRLALSDIISRIDDGHPSPGEAWARIPRSEADSALWTEEMREAYGVIDGMTDRIAARVAFIESYQRILAKSRQAYKPAKWIFTPGLDRNHREAILREARDKKLLSDATIMKFLPDPEVDGHGMKMLNGAIGEGGPEKFGFEEIHAMINRMPFMGNPDGEKNNNGESDD